MHVRSRKDTQEKERAAGSETKEKFKVDRTSQFARQWFSAEQEGKSKQGAQAHRAHKSKSMENLKMHYKL